jgi:hypothetical protein
MFRTGIMKRVDNLGLKEIVLDKLGAIFFQYGDDEEYRGVSTKWAKAIKGILRYLILILINTNPIRSRGSSTPVLF